MARLGVSAAPRWPTSSMLVEHGSIPTRMACIRLSSSRSTTSAVQFASSWRSAGLYGRRKARPSTRPSSASRATWSPGTTISTTSMTPFASGCH